MHRFFCRGLAASCRRSSDFSHVVVGGGVVGAAIAAELQAQPGSSVLLVEQHPKLGMETTARNLEVIHAGLYYPADSLKGRLCVAGKHKLYEAQRRGVFDLVQVPLRQCGKWVVAQDDAEMAYLEGLHRHATAVGVPTTLRSSAAVAGVQPAIAVGRGILESPTTGIISAHSLTLFYETQFDNAGGTVALNTRLDAVERVGNAYELRLCDPQTAFGVSADNWVNAAGLHAPRCANMLLPPHRHVPSFFAKGLYYAYTPPPQLLPPPSVLVYPCPNPNASSLGVHLTFDLAGAVRFGPDLEWVDAADARDLDYDVSTASIPTALEAIRRYFPSVSLEALQPSYAGVRPKVLLAADNRRQFADFVIREEAGFPGFVNLLGIESPGLTALWAIAEYVRDIYYK